MNPFNWALASIKERGLLRTVRVAGSAVGDFLFDLRYGTDTRRWIKAKELDVNSKSKVHAASYQATKARPFLKLLRSLNFPDDSVLVDFGSGKGRVLLLAAHHGFRKIIGVEFSPQLCALARRNIMAYSKGIALPLPIEVVEADAATLEITREMNVFYFYNPFGPAVMSQVLGNLRRSMESTPRKVWLIYNTPVRHELIDQSGLFTNCTRYEIGGTEFRVYIR